MGKITDTEKIEKIKTIFKEMLDVESMKGRKLISKDEHEEFVHECSFDDISESLWKASRCIEKIALVVFEDGGNELTELTNPFGDSRFGG